MVTDVSSYLNAISQWLKSSKRLYSSVWETPSRYGVNRMPKPHLSATMNSAMPSNNSWQTATNQPQMTNDNIYHTPVLLKESVNGLAIKPEGVYVDVTFGGGGHSQEILKNLSSEGRLYGLDQDADAERNAKFSNKKGNFIFVRTNFRYLHNWMRYYEEEYIDGLIADLGVSSHHFDDFSRGFSFRQDAPLDMRMNARAGMTAAEILNRYSEQQLADIFYLYGELRQARRLAATICQERQKTTIQTTQQLAQVVEKHIGKDREKKDLARLFQALRIEVNDEMTALKEMLQAATNLLRTGGRLSVITYHSLEDRIVKNYIRSGNAEGKLETDFYGRRQAPLKMINNKVITPDDDEIQRNPRSRSAKLRIAEKI